jgi:hypothetical protein
VAQNRAPNQSLIAAVAGAVILGWLFSLGIGAVQENWTPLTITTPVMLILAGYAFGIRLTRSSNGNGKEDRHE